MKIQREFFLSFAKEPQLFISKWIISQSRGLFNFTLRPKICKLQIENMYQYFPFKMKIQLFLSFKVLTLLHHSNKIRSFIVNKVF
jgi:hypothetical protein